MPSGSILKVAHKSPIYIFVQYIIYILFVFLQFSRIF